MNGAAPIYVPLDALWLTAEQVANVCDVTRSWLDEFKVRRPDGWRKFGDARNAKVLYHVAEIEADVRGCVGCRRGAAKQEAGNNQPTKQTGEPHMNKIKSRYTASEWREMGLSLYAKRPDEFAAEREIKREKVRRAVEAAVGVPLLVICAAAFVVCCAVM